MVDHGAGEMPGWSNSPSLSPAKYTGSWLYMFFRTIYAILWTFLVAMTKLSAGSIQLYLFPDTLIRTRPATSPLQCLHQCASLPISRLYGVYSVHSTKYIACVW